MQGGFIYDFFTHTILLFMQLLGPNPSNAHRIRARGIYGHDLHWNWDALLRGGVGSDVGVGTLAGRRFVTWAYIAGGILTLGLLIYLGVALLRPEKF